MDAYPPVGSFPIMLSYAVFRPHYAGSIDFGMPSRLHGFDYWLGNRTETHGFIMAHVTEV